MALTTLNEDLMREFLKERHMINEQVEMLDPLAVSLRQPAAQRLVNGTLLIIVEILCYLATIGGIAFVAIMHTIYPFSVLAGIYNDEEMITKIGNKNFNFAALAIYGITVLCILLIFAIGRLAAAIRKKNKILYLAGKDIKIMIGQHLERKAAIDIIEQNHLLDDTGISLPNDIDNNDINNIVNPGYGD